MTILSATLGGAHGSAIRLALFYGAFFLVVGLHLPYWPVWLAERGMDGSQIGVLLAAAMAIKIVTNPFFAHIADRRGERRSLMVLLACASLASFALFAAADTFWALLAITVLFGATMSALMPLGENVAMLTVREEGIDYGRVRLWGSITFILAALVGGQLLEGGPSSRIYWAILGAVALSTIACRLLPRRQAAPATLRAPIARLLRARSFVLFLIAASLVQASHAVYYGFATLHWQSLGIGEFTIGLLWAEGVVAEIVLFAVGTRLLRRTGITGLLILAAGLATVRWLGTAATDDVPLLFLLQTLHAFSFGACHLAAMHFIANALPGSVSATGQSLYSATATGAVFAPAMLAAGALYDAAGGLAYLAMAAMTLAAAGAALLLARTWRGETLDL